MSHEPPQRLDQLDACIDRCNACGAWRWRGQCRTCQPIPNEQEGVA